MEEYYECQIFDMLWPQWKWKVNELNTNIVEIFKFIKYEKDLINKKLEI